MNRPQSYFHFDRKLFTMEQTMAKLRERSGQLPSEAMRSPKEKSALKWEKVVPGASSRKTECGRYSCSRVTAEGKTSYELWKANPSPNSSPMVRLHHGLDNFLQAQTLAQQDADK